MFRKISILSLLLASISATAFAQQPMNGRFARGAGESPAKLSRAGSKSGYLGHDPYSGSYLPRTSGPLANEPGDATVKEKITNGFGDCDLVHQIIKDNANKDTAAKLEAAGTPGFREKYLREGYDASAESWTGFCHNWAPAGLDNAVNFMVNMDRIYADVPFGIGDMRELVTFALPSAYDYAWYGKRHNDKDKAEEKSDELDPVDLLSIMETHVGPGKGGIVLDVDPGYMVWNQPVYKWNREATEVTGDAQGPKKAPRDGKAYKVKLNATYGIEGHYGYRGETLSRDSNWEFFVYTDKKGNIVDSAWDPAFSNKIPDFAWAAKGDRYADTAFDTIKKVAKDGVKVSSIEEFCKVMSGLSKKPTRSERKKLKKLLDEICPVLDQNKLSEYIRKTAERIGEDYSVLEDSIRVDTEAHI